VTNPPAGTQIQQRPNGDTKYYHPGTNQFAVTKPDPNAVGKKVIRTYFPPEKNGKPDPTYFGRTR
jgi:pyocin large subunit-like protein